MTASRGTVTTALRLRGAISTRTGAPTRRDPSASAMRSSTMRERSSPTGMTARTVPRAFRSPSTSEVLGSIPSHWVHASNAMFATAYHRTVIFECDAAVSDDAEVLAAQTQRLMQHYQQ